MSNRWMVRCVRLQSAAVITETGAYLPTGWEPFGVEEGGYVWLRWKMPTGGAESVPGGVAPPEPVAGVSEAVSGEEVSP